MKKILLLIAAVLFTTALFAENINQNKAKQVAKAFAAQNDRNAGQLNADIVYAHPMPNKRDAALYVVNLGESGFVIVSANDVAHPVLGYSFDRPWPTGRELPSQVLGYLDDLANQIEYATDQTPDRGISNEWQELLSINPNNPINSQGNRTQVGPLLTTTWDQGQYYNAMCPADVNGPDGHALTGCVATAMAQIVKYWGYPIQGRGSHSYNLSGLDPGSIVGGFNDYNTLYVNYDSSTYDYNHMPDVLTSESTQEEIDAVAQLMYHCGVAVNMFYGPSASGAQVEDVRSALISYYGFALTLGYAQRQLYTDTEWSDSLKANIDRGEPVYYCGSNAFNSHAFVLDGYNNDNYYHFNFGWSGDSDGWYLLSAINPSWSFNEWQSAIMGIRPNEEEHAAICHRKMYVQSDDYFTVTEPIDLYPMRGGTAYRAANEMTGTRLNLNFVPEDESGQLVLDVLNFENEQSVVIYDGINKDSLVRVIETRNLDDWSTVTYHTWFYEGLPTDTIMQNMAGTDFSPVVSTRHGFTVVVYSYGGIPESFHLRVSDASDCRMVSNLTAIQDNDGVLVSWTENGDATQWQVMVGDDIYNCNETHILLTELLPNETYEVKVRAICDEQHASSWNSIVVNKKVYWTDVVKSEPEGYLLDGDTIRITTPEGLAWVAHCVDSMWINGTNYVQFCSKVISIENDLNLNGYYWNPIRVWFGNVYGNGHMINNMEVSTSIRDCGLFTGIWNSEITGISMTNSKVNSVNCSGSIAGYINNCLVNYCSSENYIISVQNSNGGGLFGTVVGCQINNCYAYGDNYSQFGYGGLVGVLYNSEITNCVTSLGEAFCWSIPGWAGLLTEETNGGSFSNCFSNISLAKRTWTSNGPEYDSLAKRAYFLGNVDYVDAIDNLAAFNIATNSMGMLIADTAVNYTLGENMDVITALNNKVAEYNSPDLMIWVRDDVTHMPVFGDYFEPSCYNPTNLVISNANMHGDPTVRTQLSWTQIGEPDHWEVLYVESGGDLSDGVVVSVDSNPCVITDVPVGTKFDFYVRSVCDDENISAWSAPVSYSQDMQKWIDVVTTQPESYNVDPDGIVLISCAEDLVWWAKQGCNENAKLVSDIDLGEYKWQPISWFGNKLDGDNYCINNLVVIEDDSSYGNGLFGELCGVVSNLGIKNCIIYGGVRVGAIFGNLSSGEVNNCYVIDGSINGNNIVGGIGGSISGGNVINCYSKNQITSNWIGKNGVLIGEMSGGMVRNCYGTNTYPSQSFGNTNTLVGWMDSGSVMNCYSKIPCVVNGYVREGEASVSDTASFFGQGLDWTLNAPVYFEEIETTDLCQALNLGVINMNNEKFKSWVPDNSLINYGYPIFGDYYTVTCPNVDDVMVKNVVVNGENAVVVSWTAEENTSEWQIKYKRHDMPSDEPVFINATSNPYTIFNIPLTYEYDFNVRTICSDSDHSGWSNTVTEVIDLPYWTDIVVSQPEGYTVDENGNVFISSAEGLAWLATNSKETGPNFNGKEVSLLCDLDISDYRWYPIGAGSGWFAGSFDGNGHKISGIHLNSNEFAYCGLFGVYLGKTLKNVIMDGGTVTNKNTKDGSNTSAGGLVGFLDRDDSYNTNTMVNNCHSSIQVKGNYNVGGLIGKVHTSSIINSSSTGAVCGGFECGGLIGISSETQIINSYATGDIIHNNNSNGAWCLGGFIGQSQIDNVHNCYSIGDVVSSMERIYVGKVIGAYDANSEYSNIYGLHDDVTPNMFGDYQLVPLYGGLFQDTTLFTNLGVLENHITINNCTYTNLLDALNAWVDANNTNGEYLHWVADTENVNGGFPMLEPVPSTTYQVQPIVQGWNWWSTYIEQEGIDGLTMLENSLGHNGLMIKTQVPYVQNYYPQAGYDYWFGSLTNVGLTNESCYQISVSSDCQVVMSGAETNPSDHPITIQPGWNWIGYPVATQQSLSVGLANFNPAGNDLIKGQGSSATYYANYGWFPTSFTLVPGQGYMYYSNATQNQTLTYNVGRGEEYLTESPSRVWTNDIHGYADNMTLIATVKEDGEEQRREEIELGAFVNGECRGSAVLQYFEPTGRYYAVLTISGEEGDRIAFGLVDRDTRMENQESHNAVTFTTDAVLGNLDRPYIVEFGENNATDIMKSVRMYPNPVDRNAAFALDVPSEETIKEVTITNALGETVIHESGQISEQMSGIKVSGVYLVRVICRSGQVYVGRLVVR